MAPLRSSRSNRHLHPDGGPQGRMRGGIVDHDPMEGLPVRRWEMMDVTIKQDLKDEENDEDGKEGSNPNWPWADLPLPKDFHLLPAHSQELLRRARAPNKNPNMAVFNRQTGEYERPNLNPNNPAAMTPVTKASHIKENTNLPPPEATIPTKDVGPDGAGPDENHDTDKTSHEQFRERTITLKRWIPLSQPIADQKPEPKYLADRRPGLPPLYGHRSTTNPSGSGTTSHEANISSTATNTNAAMTRGDVVVGSVTVPADRGAMTSGYRVLADGTTMPVGPGMGPTMGSSTAPIHGEVVKRRHPPPPRRKRKGGPGRSRRKFEVPERVAEGSGNPTTVSGTAVGKGPIPSRLAGGADLGAGGGGGLGQSEVAIPKPNIEATRGAQNQGEQKDRIRGDVGGDVGGGGGGGGGGGDDDDDDEEEEEAGEEEESMSIGNDLDMADAEPEVEEETNSNSHSHSNSGGDGDGDGGSEDQGSEEGEIDESEPPTLVSPPPPPPPPQQLQPPQPLPPLPAAAAATLSKAPPDVSIQPPSPDLLGNLETEIQGMEQGGPTL